MQYQQLVEAGALGRLPFIEMELLDKQNVRVVFQGVEGAYSQAAMKKYFPDNEDNFHVTTFRKHWRQSRRGRQILQFFRLKILLLEQSMKYMICW